MKVFIFLTASFLFSVANAFTLNSSTNSNLKGWAGGDVQIYVNPANCPAGVDVVELVKEAVKFWNNVPTSSIKVSYGGGSTLAAPSNPPVVYCATSFSGIPGSPSADYVPGAASVSAPNGQIVAGQIFLNATSGQANIANFSTSVNIITMAHEIGHLLGLGHSHTTTALMWYDGTNRTGNALGQDDIDGMSYLYPSNELDKDQFGGCALVNSGTNLPPPPMAAILLILLALPLVVLVKLKGQFNRKSIA